MRFPLHYIGKVSKFVVSNAMGTVVDTLVLWVCSHFIFADYGYVGAGRGKVSLYKGKECVLKNIPQEEAVAQLLALIEADKQ